MHSYMLLLNTSFKIITSIYSTLLISSSLKIFYILLISSSFIPLSSLFIIISSLIIDASSLIISISLISIKVSFFNHASFITPIFSSVNLSSLIL